MRIILRGRGTDYERGGQGDYCCIIPLTSPLSESHGVGGQVKNPPERFPITTSETGRTSRGNRTTHRDDDGGSDAVDKNRVIVVRGRALGTRKRRRHSPKSLSTTARKNWDHRCAGRGGGGEEEKIIVRVNSVGTSLSATRGRAAAATTTTTAAESE
jgi:hypothetical protein